MQRITDRTFGPRSTDGVTHESSGPRRVLGSADRAFDIVAIVNARTTRSWAREAYCNPGYSAVGLKDRFELVVAEGHSQNALGRHLVRQYQQRA